MLYSLLCAVLMAAAAIVPGAAAGTLDLQHSGRALQKQKHNGGHKWRNWRKHHGRRKGRKHGGNPPTYLPQPPNGSVTRHRASSKCVASADSKSYSASKNAHVAAVAEATAYGCSKSLDDGWLKNVEKVFKKKAAFAIAAAITNAAAKCENQGQNTYSCASADAFAKAWARATASAYAATFADALNKCGCGEAAASTYATAASFEVLVAEVESTADAKVCVVGQGSASAEAHSSCIQIVYARVFAKAIAKALIEGKCYHGYSDLDASAKAKAETIIDTWEYVNC